MITLRLLKKDYNTLTDRLVPMGEQIEMSRADIVQRLRTKTREFTEEDIEAKFERGLKASI